MEPRQPVEAKRDRGRTGPEITAATLEKVPAQQARKVRYAETPAQITTPASVATRIGTFTFRDGYASPECTQLLYNYLDLHRAIDTFLNGMPAVSMYALRQGFREQGLNDN